MKAVISNSLGSAKLKFVEIKDAVIAEEIHRKDSEEATICGSALNIDGGRSFDKNNNKGNRGRSKNNRSKFRNGRLQCWHCGKTGYLKRNCKAPIKNDGKNQDVVNAATKEV